MNGNGYDDTNANSGEGAGTTNFGSESGAGSSAGSATGTATGGRTVEFKLSGEDIMAKVRQLIEEGNARRIIVRNADGSNMVEFPLTAGVIGAALMPVYAALGAAVALATNMSIVVEKRD